MMNKFFLISIVIAMSSYGQVISFSEDKFSFGDIDNIQQVTRDIEFTNTGDKKLIIERVKASCGCTASKVAKKELEPNETSFVTVSFNPRGRRGKQTKKVTLFSNDMEDDAKKISFTANVVPSWEIVPNRLEFKTNNNNKIYEEKNFLIKNTGNSKVLIEKIESTNENLTIIIPENREIDPGQNMKVIASVNNGYLPPHLESASLVVTAIIGEETTSGAVRVNLRPPPKIQF